MHGLVVQIRGHGGIKSIRGRVAVSLLLVPDEMLGACNDGLLKSLNGLKREATGEIRIIAWKRSACSSRMRLRKRLLKPSQLRPPSATRPIGPTTGPGARVISQQLANVFGLLTKSDVDSFSFELGTHELRSTIRDISGRDSQRLRTSSTYRAVQSVRRAST